MEINFLVMLHQYLPITRAGGRELQELYNPETSATFSLISRPLFDDFLQRACHCAAGGGSAAVSSVLGAGQELVLMAAGGWRTGGWEEGALPASVTQWPVAALNRGPAISIVCIM